jgi:hypothetical protein
MALDLTSPWVFGTRWLWKIFVVFGVIDPPAKVEPLPVDLAEEMLVSTQRDLLRAQSAAEQSNAVAAMYREREARLKSEVQRLKSEVKSNE